MKQQSTLFYMGQLLFLIYFEVESSWSYTLVLYSLQFGGIYGPLLQDLREHLEENPDHVVAPEWSETVRNSVSVSC